jgi:hypothetical protein
MASTAVQARTFFFKKKKSTARQSVIDSWASSICLGADLAHIIAGLNVRPSMLLRCEPWALNQPGRRWSARTHSTIRALSKWARHGTVVMSGRAVPAHGLHLGPGTARSDNPRPDNPNDCGRRARSPAASRGRPCPTPPPATPRSRCCPRRRPSPPSAASCTPS